MIKKLKINPTSGKLDLVSTLPEFDSDPSSPVSEDAWVRRISTNNSLTGTPMGLLLGITYPPEYSYELRYRTNESTTVTLGEGNGFSYSVAIKTSDYTLDDNDDLIIVNSGGSTTMTIPTAVSMVGKLFNIKNSGAGASTINTTSGQTIDGFASGAITLSQYDSISVVSDGTNWVII